MNAAAGGLAPDGWPLVLVRALAVGGLLSAAGTLVFRTAIVPAALARMPAPERVRVERALARLAGASLAAIACGLVFWSAIEAGTMAGTNTWSGRAAALPTVLGRTHFGHLVLVQAVLAAAAAGVLRYGEAGRRIAAMLAVADAALQAGHGHAMAMSGPASLLFGLDAVHLLAASCWAGCLLPLLLVVWLAPPRAGAAAARSFSPLGKGCVVLLAGSALVQGWVLVGSVRALLTMTYGWVVLLKTALFGVLFGLAVLNRYRLAPALLSAEPDRARRRLIGSIAVQAATGLLAVLAAAVLSGLVPGMDM